MTTESTAQQTDWVELPPQADTGAVRLRVADLEQALTFYRDVLGYLPEQTGTNAVALLPGAGQRPHFILEEHRGARRYPRTAGLFHVAIRMPSRRDLARVLRQMVDAQWPVGGMSDHGVSEALYLNDAEGNGIEIYSDRPREVWPHDESGVDMTTVALDLQSLAAELPGSPPWQGLPEGTDIGHVHLQVGDLARSEDFYAGLLGFRVTQRSYPGALFVAAGGYHHHIGLNTWAGSNLPPAPLDATGLISFQLILPDQAALDAMSDRLRAAGQQLEERDGGVLVRDPDNIGVELVAEG